MKCKQIAKSEIKTCENLILLGACFDKGNPNNVFVKYGKI